MKPYRYVWIFALTAIGATSPPSVNAQIDHDDMANWAFHPDKPWMILDNYSLDIAVIAPDLSVDTVLQNPSNHRVNTGVDVFFVHPTILTDMNGTVRENVPIADQPAFQIEATIVAQGGLLARYGRLFAPRYRQGTPATYLGSALDSVQAAVIATAYRDVRGAFLHYLQQHNNGNRIILASHSQGSLLMAMLLRDVFDEDALLRERLVAAVLGSNFVYAAPGEVAGGWWENIPICTTMDQCECVMNWRTYKEGQALPLTGSSLPQLNTLLVDSGYVHRVFVQTQDRVLQDSLYYGVQASSIPYYISPRPQYTFGGNAGFVAFADLYQARFLRSGNTRVGLMVQHTPAANDQRPNELADEESSPAFSFMGYHNKDYHIYLWALMEQLDQKLAACSTTTGVTEFKGRGVLQAWPNPAMDRVRIEVGEQVLNDTIIRITSATGQQVRSATADGNGYIDIAGLEPGMYLLQHGQAVARVVVAR
jgi:hypothetical protein